MVWLGGGGCKNGPLYVGREGFCEVKIERQGFRCPPDYLAGPQKHRPPKYNISLPLLSYRSPLAIFSLCPLSLCSLNPIRRQKAIQCCPHSLHCRLCPLQVIKLRFFYLREVLLAMEETGQLKRAFIDATAGLIAGGISRTVTSPLDVIKIRFQVQLEPTTSWALLHKNLSQPSKYTGMLQATRDIFREEGLPGFWRGNVPALLMVMPYTAIQFAVLHQLKTFAAGSSKTEDHIYLSPYLSYISGALAGCAATVGSYPFDLLRTLLASQGEPKVYPTMRTALVEIVKTRGFRGLYAGLSPTLVEIIPYAGLQFGTYDTFKRWTMTWNLYRSSNTNLHSREDGLSSFQLFLCGLAAGTCAKLVCHPLDVVKKRFQIEGLQRHPRYGARVEHRAYRNMFDALRRILQREGWAGLYKGIVPSTVKAAPAGAVTFVAYEYTSDWLESALT